MIINASLCRQRAKGLLLVLLCAGFRMPAVYGQGGNQKVFTADITNFWNAYDSIRTTADSTRQLHYIQTLYIDKGTPGLKAFMQARDYSAELWVKLINRFPKFWNSVRANTLSACNKSQEIEKSIVKLKSLYPELKDAKMYFTIGGLRSGGTTMADMVLIGAEIATGNAETDVSEFPDKWLAGVFKEQSADNIVPLNIHEYVHTQQRAYARNLLGQSIREGACDFITELVMGKPLPNNYLRYGREHEKELREQFKVEMFTNSYTNWLYNGSRAKTVADLGYFMGYAICKAYYNQASSKQKAIKDIIELDYSDSSRVEKFLEQSGYYPEKLDKAALLLEFEKNRPVVLKTEPFAIGDTLVDAGLKELKLVFSMPMDNTVSINFGPKGKEHYPIKGVTGFSEDGRILALKIELKPGHSYEFLVTDKSFRSKEGFPLKPMTVQFRTR